MSNPPTDAEMDELLALYAKSQRPDVDDLAYRAMACNLAPRLAERVRELQEALIEAVIPLEVIHCIETYYEPLSPTLREGVARAAYAMRVALAPVKETE